MLQFRAIEKTASCSGDLLAHDFIILLHLQSQNIVTVSACSCDCFCWKPTKIDEWTILGFSENKANWFVFKNLTLRTFGKSQSTTNLFVTAKNVTYLGTGRWRDPSRSRNYIHKMLCRSQPRKLSCSDMLPGRRAKRLKRVQNIF